VSAAQAISMKRDSDFEKDGWECLKDAETVANEMEEGTYEPANNSWCHLHHWIPSFLPGNWNTSLESEHSKTKRNRADAIMAIASHLEGFCLILTNQEQMLEEGSCETGNQSWHNWIYLLLSKIWNTSLESDHSKTKNDSKHRTDAKMAKFNSQFEGLWMTLTMQERIDLKEKLGFWMNNINEMMVTKPTNTEQWENPMKRAFSVPYVVLNGNQQKLSTLFEEKITTMGVKAQRLDRSVLQKGISNEMKFPCFFLVILQHERFEAQFKEAKVLSAYHKAYSMTDALVVVLCQHSSTETNLFNLQNFTSLEGHDGNVCREVVQLYYHRNFVSKNGFREDGKRNTEMESVNKEDHERGDVSRDPNKQGVKRLYKVLLGSNADDSTYNLGNDA